MKMYKIHLALAIGFYLHNAGAQPLLLRPSLVSNLDYVEDVSTDMALTGDKDAIAFHGIIQLKTPKMRQYALSMSLGTSWDSTDLNHISYDFQAYELGMGRYEREGDYYTQGWVTLGNQFTKYRYFNELENIDYSTIWQLASTVQCQAGYLFESFEVAAGVRLTSMYSYKRQADTGLMTEKEVIYWKSQTQNPHTFAVEPFVSAFVAVDDTYALTFQIKAPMYSQFSGTLEMPDRFSISVGLKFY